jgi:predicted metal-dependent hydrolase
MNAIVHYQAAPVVRRNFQFQLDQVPRFWFGGDVFRTRMFDALSLAFPDGERYFIESVRLYRKDIQDADLAQRVTDFIKQEAQHGIAHEKANQVLREQGMPIDEFLGRVNHDLKWLLEKMPAKFNIALTAAYEHLTALMAETFFSDQNTMREVHPYVRSLFAWHAVEEMEHRDVAFDVMRDVAKVDENSRRAILVLATALMMYYTLYRANHMLKVDGYSAIKRAKLFAKGLPWFLGRKGKLTVMRHAYMDWFKKDFHPSQHPIIANYGVWVATLAATNDPIAAGDALWQAARKS